MTISKNLRPQRQAARLNANETAIATNCCYMRVNSTLRGYRVIAVLQLAEDPSIAS